MLPNRVEAVLVRYLARLLLALPFAVSPTVRAQRDPDVPHHAAAWATRVCVRAALRRGLVQVPHHGGRFRGLVLAGAWRRNGLQGSGWRCLRARVTLDRIHRRRQWHRAAPA